MLRNRTQTVLVAVLVCILASVSYSADSEVVGVFGISDFGENTALALWIPLNSTESVSGIRWYNNDSQAGFGEVLAVAGVHGELCSLSNAISVGADVLGRDSGWSELVFDRPLASTTEGFYLFFKMPENAPFEHAGYGGGVGIGYQAGDGTPRSWVTGDGEYWDPIGSEFRMAVEPLMDASKSAQGGQGVLVLETNMNPKFDVVDNTVPALSKQRLKISPNPFNPQTEIKFSLESAAMVNLEIFDVRGRVVRHLLHEGRGPGDHVIVWNGRSDSGESCSSGVYLARFVSGDEVVSARMTLVQ